LDVNATIPDTSLRYCRRCSIPGCSKCSTSGADRCESCSLGYVLQDVDGTCGSSFRHVWLYIVVLGTTMLAVIAVWYVELRTRPLTNVAGLTEGLAFRSRTKLHMAKQVADSSQDRAREPQGRRLWPLTTNLLHTQVAGPGLTLHFNFQIAIIVWGVIILLGWVALAAVVDPDFFILGLKAAATPRQFCAVVAWGYQTQHRLMQWKVIFVLLAYIVTFVLCLGHAVFQHRRFEAMDDASTMGDFAALCVGLPSLKGAEKAEEKLQELFQSATGQSVVGVSICWDFKVDKDFVMEAVEDLSPLPRNNMQEVFMAEYRANFRVRRNSTTNADEPLYTRKLFRNLDAVFGFGTSASNAANRLPPEKSEVIELLHEVECSGQAFVVFETEDGRNAAVEAVKEAGGLLVDGARVHLEDQKIEPDTVLWANFTSGDKRLKWRLFVGSLVTFMSLILWGVLFYVPYVYYVASFTYAQGAEPDFASSLVFTVLVVAGNQMLYIICGAVAERVGFSFVEDQEVAYTVMYTVACFLNVVLDLAVTGYVSYKMMVGIGAHTYDGRLLENLTSFEEIFESYMMQKALGSALYAYAFPSCFLLPFLIEPVFAIWLPFHVVKYLVRSRPEVRGHNAEMALKIFSPMDLSRYADLMLNVLLAVLVLFFPGGYTVAMFVGLIVSHVWIYLLDHYRVLRCVPAFCYSSTKVDDWANLLLGLPCGCLASCLVFKANCEPGLPCASGWALGFRCCAAFTLHCWLYLLLLLVLVPWLGKRPHDTSVLTYKDVAAQSPVNWFSLNPVHCLRSMFIYGHKPPCDFYVCGKEHLMRPNPAIGTHFSDVAAEKEVYGHM